MGNTIALGVAYRDQDIDGGTIGLTNPKSIKGTTVYATQQLGYSTAAYGAVTQQTNKATGVTLNNRAATLQ